MTLNQQAAAIIMPTLAPKEVHIWSAKQPSTFTLELDATLSHDERARARRFRFQKHRLAYMFAHTVLRDVLSQYLLRPPGDICFAENEFGKPFIERTHVERAVEFNLSHADGRVLVAVCHGRRIGIDIEEIRSRDDILTIAESYFTPRECAFILGQPQSAQERTFLRCWTRKEAYIKGLGKGLSIPLNSFDTLISSGQPVGTLESGTDSSEGTTWQLADLDRYEGYVAAVAVESVIDRLVHLEWQPCH